ncbi:hypothetical protein JY96_21800 [Aquabacterium sp. NJ1]|nr:hypothetical protein JY96_21800 [Aquabacterium sp. NJ1]
MIKSIFKLVFITGLLFLGYQAASLYYLKELVDDMSHCYKEADVCKVLRQPITERQLEPHINQALICQKKRQSLVGSILHPIPKTDSSSAPNDYIPEDTRQKLASMCSDFEAQ